MLTDEGKADLAIRLIERASYRVPQFAEQLRNSHLPDDKIVARAMQALSGLLDIIDEHGPDADWWGDYFELTGDHYVLTEEGWIPADQNTFEATGEVPMEVLAEVNQPATTPGATP